MHLELEKACNIVIDYTGMYPCSLARKVLRSMIIQNGINSIEDHIISKLYLRYSNIPNRNKILKTQRTKQYNLNTIQKKTVSKFIIKRTNNITEHTAFLLRMQDIKYYKTFSTLDEAITYRDNILRNTHEKDRNTI